MLSSVHVNVWSRADDESVTLHLFAKNDGGAEITLTAGRGRSAARTIPPKATLLDVVKAVRDSADAVVKQIEADRQAVTP